MKPFSMNLSRFKKIHQDKMSTLLKDPDGHEIRIVHSKLPAIQRKQLEGLPMAFEEGGVAQPQPAPSAHTPSAAAQMAQTPVDAQVGATPQNEDLVSPDQTLNAPAAVSLEQKSAREQQAIETAKGVQTANIEKGYNDQKAAIAQQEQNSINAVKQHADDYSQWIQSNPINPNHYQENMSAGRKVTNALALLAGGFGQGLVGGSNPAMDFLNSQIDRDIAAQKSNAENNKNVYGAYRELYGDQLAATTAAKASMLDIYNHKMQLLAAQLGTPQAKANADAFAAKAAIERNQLLLQTAGRLGTLNMGGGSSLGQSPGPSAPGGSNAQVSPQSDAASPGVENLPAVQLYDKAASLFGKNTVNADEQNEANKPKVYSVLSPNAQRVISSMQYSSDADQRDYEKTTEQLKHAQQAEKVLNGPNGDGVGGIHDLIQRMYKNSGSGSYLSGAGLHVRENAREGAESIPFVGKGLKAALDILPKDQATKQYETGKAALLTDLATGLKGILAPTDIDQVVKPNLPALGDSPKDVADKEHAMINSILKALETNMLEKKGILVKQKAK